MSYKVVSWVLEHSRTANPIEQLVLLAIAEYCHDDGTGAYPSLTTIARRTKLSARTARRAVQRPIVRGFGKFFETTQRANRAWPSAGTSVVPPTSSPGIRLNT